ELYSYYPLLRLPGSAGYIGRFDAGLAEEMFVPASPAELLARYRKAEAVLKPGAAKEGSTETEAMRAQVLELLAQGIRHIEEMTDRYDDLVRRISDLIDSTEFAPLFDKKRLLFSIGYNAEE